MGDFDGLHQTVTLSQGLGSVAPGFAARVENSTQVAQEVIRLRQTHDLYDEYSPKWQMYLDAYEGGDNVTNIRYLGKHVRESDHDHELRAERLHYINYCKPLVEFFTYFVYSETIQRSGGTNEKWYQDFIRDVNLKGDDITSFMKLVSDDMQIFGMAFILVDSPVNPLADGEPLSAAVAEQLKIRPYWVLLKALEIIDWDTDKFDNLTYVKRRECVTERDAVGYKRCYEKYTEWYPDKVVISYIDVTSRQEPKLDTSKGQLLVNNLGEIPIEVVRYERGKKDPFIGTSFLTDFAKNNIEVMNITSLLQEFNYKQCFNILAKEADEVIPTLDGNEGVIGVGNVFEYPTGGKAPVYISPPVDGAKYLQTERTLIEQSMFKRAAQDTMSSLFNGEGASGFSQAQNFSKTVPFISNRADTLERTENRMMMRTLRYLSGKAWDGKIFYKDRYELTNINDAMSQLLQLFRDLQLPSETFVKEELKRLLHEMDGKLPPDTLAKCIKEIDDMDFKKWQETQVSALVGRGSSPGEQNQNKQTNTLAEAAAEAKAKPAATTKTRNPKNK